MEKKKTSKELLLASAFELSKKCPVEKLTVKEITENCGISRKTFYNNFIDINDMVSWGFSRDIMPFFHQISETYTWRNAIADMLNYLDPGKRKTLKKAYQPRYMDYFYQNYLNTLNGLLSKYKISLDDRHRFVLENVSFMHLHIVNRWILDKTNYSPDELYENILATVPDTFVEIFSEANIF